MNEGLKKNTDEQTEIFEELVAGVVDIIQTISSEKVEETIHVSRKKVSRYFLFGKPKSISFFSPNINNGVVVSQYTCLLSFSMNGTLNHFSTNHPTIIDEYFPNLNVYSALGGISMYYAGGDWLIHFDNSPGLLEGFKIKIESCGIKVSNEEKFMKNELKKLHKRRG